ncbi:MAG: hypothetical protein RMJ67_05400 [Elusimicrobiota bacterium]|nr:hypothetical protein [Endomicrobiia bacterium]MCX7910983.1 hypothetical protein [Endomicrobiia bacterium]MDW8165925.1 hypothetical protein [Elusimicrobiota bacterium]
MLKKVELILILSGVLFFNITCIGHIHSHEDELHNNQICVFCLFSNEIIFSILVIYCIFLKYQLASFKISKNRFIFSTSLSCRSPPNFSLF